MQTKSTFMAVKNKIIYLTEEICFICHVLQRVYTSIYVQLERFIYFTTHCFAMILPKTRKHPPSNKRGKKYTYTCDKNELTIKRRISKVTVSRGPLNMQQKLTALDDIHSYVSM